MTRCVVCGTEMRGELECREASGVRPGLSLILWVCALILVVPAGGCSSGAVRLPGHAKQSGPSAAQTAAKAQRLKAAKAAAASALAEVEVCESAVMADASLEDLSAKAAHARDAVEAFSRTEDAKLLPGVTSAIELAEQDYLDSCAAWRADEAAAQAKWKSASVPGANGSVESLRHGSSYRALWVKGSTDLGQARIALRDATL